MCVLRSIDSAPKDGTFILLFGKSGYCSTPLRCEVARWDAKYRPRDPWVTYSGECFSASGGPPTHWMPLPNVVLNPAPLTAVPCPWCGEPVRPNRPCQTCNNSPAMGQNGDYVNRLLDEAAQVDLE